MLLVDKNKYTIKTHMSRITQGKHRNTLQEFKCSKDCFFYSFFPSYFAEVEPPLGGDRMCGNVDRICEFLVKCFSSWCTHSCAAFVWCSCSTDACNCYPFSTIGGIQCILYYGGLSGTFVVSFSSLALHSAFLYDHLDCTHEVQPLHSKTMFGWFQLHIYSVCACAVDVLIF